VGSDPEIKVGFYRDDEGTVPVLEWLRQLQRTERIAFVRCVTRIRRLAKEGHELGRPEASYLQDGIHTLQVRWGGRNYRILYFFYRQDVAVLTQAFRKKAELTEREIDQAVRCRAAFRRDPARHTYREERLLYG
jgi:phage-related protein